MPLPFFSSSAMVCSINLDESEKVQSSESASMSHTIKPREYRNFSTSLVIPR
jgi:hypothetical protein